MSTIPMYYSGLSACSFKEFDRSFLPLAIQLQSHSTSVLIVNLILRAVKNLVRSPMNILAGYGLFRLQVALLEQHPNILQIDSHEYKSLSVYNTFPQTITKMPHWARMQGADHSPPARAARARGLCSSSCSSSSKVKRGSSLGRGEQIKAHCRKVVPLALCSCNSCRYNNYHLTFWHIRWAKQQASQCLHNIAQGSKSQPWAKQVYDILLLVFRGYGYEERHLREEQMKITKKVKARVDKLIDNILDGTDLHVDYKLLLMSLVDCRPQSKRKWAHSLFEASKFLQKRTHRDPEDSRCPPGPGLQSCPGAKTTAFCCVATAGALRWK